MRGWAAGAFTAVLSVAAHASAGGALPSGPATALLAILAATIGFLAQTVHGANRFHVLVALLGAGQLAGHAMLTVAGHQHGHVGTSANGVMLAAHLAAVAAGAALIASASYLAGVLSHVRHAMSLATQLPVPAPAAPVGRGADQPLRSALQLAASVSHRGPPVSACC